MREVFKPVICPSDFCHYSEVYVCLFFFFSFQSILCFCFLKVHFTEWRAFLLSSPWISSHLYLKFCHLSLALAFLLLQICFTLQALNQPLIVMFLSPMFVFLYLLVFLLELLCLLTVHPWLYIGCPFSSLYIFLAFLFFRNVDG